MNCQMRFRLERKKREGRRLKSEGQTENGSRELEDRSQETEDGRNASPDRVGDGNPGLRSSKIEACGTA